MTKKKTIRPRLTPEQYMKFCSMRGVAPKFIEGKKEYRPRMTPDEFNQIRSKKVIAKTETITGNDSPLQSEQVDELMKRVEQQSRELAELAPLREFMTKKGQVSLIPIKSPKNKENRSTIAIALASDWHYEEHVSSESVMGLNEFNQIVAKRRATAFFSNIQKIISHQKKNYNIQHMILGLLGDFIGGWIHDELMQTNELSPMSAMQECKSVIVSGLKYLYEELEVDKITVVCVVGNHGRTTKKSQFANSTDVNYEYFMYKDIQSICGMMGMDDKIEFVIPKAELALLEVAGKRLLFTHGTQIKFGGGIGGLMVPLNRWIAQMNKTVQFDMCFIGHFHQSIFNKRVMVNGSIKGYDAYAIGKGLEFERPQQSLILLDSKYDFCLYTPIFVD